MSYVNSLNIQTEMPTSKVLHAPGAPCVAELVARQAAANPSALAVCSGHEVLTYAELDRHANRLANYLRSAGVGRDTAVGLYLERAPAMVVTALAILKAGGAYIPLDPLQPPARLTFMLRDSAAGVVVTTTVLAQRLPAGSWQVVTLDGEAEKIAAQPDTKPAVTVSPADLAYIIYTSGSTGQPKGVELVHSGLSNLMAWHQRAFGVT